MTTPTSHLVGPRPQLDRSHWPASENPFWLWPHFDCGHSRYYRVYWGDCPLYKDDAHRQKKKSSDLNPWYSAYYSKSLLIHLDLFLCIVCLVWESLANGSWSFWYMYNVPSYCWSYRIYVTSGLCSRFVYRVSCFILSCKFWADTSSNRGGSDAPATVKEYRCDDFFLCDPRRWPQRYTVLILVSLVIFGAYYIYDNPAALESTILNVSSGACPVENGQCLDKGGLTHHCNHLPHLWCPHWFCRLTTFIDHLDKL